MAPILTSRGSVFNIRTITTPIVACTMAVLLYTFSRSSIRAAKRNAERHREADGGQVDMRRESLRRHGALDQVPDTNWLHLFRDVKQQGPDVTGSAKSKDQTRAEKAQRSRATGVESRAAGGERGARTPVEGQLERYRGGANAMERFKEEIPPAPED